MNKPFKFKQFSIDQDRCAMKVGTDGVLLGAWASLENNAESILDIGSGTGIIALMLAQRSGVETIDAIEIDENAYEQCVENFEASPWGDRLFCYHGGLDELVEEIGEKYDMIVSNPPFFEPSPPPIDGETRIQKSRLKARFYDSLPFGRLLEGVSKLLSNDGIFSTIIPFKEEGRFSELASRFNLFPQRITRVRGNLDTEIKRSLLEFGFGTQSAKTDELTIELKRHEYTPKYITLTQDFYLKM